MYPRSLIAKVSADACDGVRHVGVIKNQRPVAVGVSMWLAAESWAPARAGLLIVDVQVLVL